MISRPCPTCGELIAPRSRCPACRPGRADTPTRDHVAYTNDARWKNLSKRIRKQSPFCEVCGGVDHLQADHVIPYSVAPELAHTEANLRVLCKTCNNRRQNTYTHTDAETVLKRLVSDYNRRPTRSGRERIAVAEKALQDLGRCPQPTPVPTATQACFPLHTPGGIG